MFFAAFETEAWRTVLGLGDYKLRCKEELGITDENEVLKVWEYLKRHELAEEERPFVFVRSAFAFQNGISTYSAWCEFREKLEQEKEDEILDRKKMVRATKRANLIAWIALGISVLGFGLAVYLAFTK